MKPTETTELKRCCHGLAANGRFACRACVLAHCRAAKVELEFMRTAVGKKFPTSHAAYSVAIETLEGLYRAIESNEERGE